MIMTNLEYSPMADVWFDPITEPTRGPAKDATSTDALDLLAGAMCVNCDCSFMAHAWSEGAPCVRHDSRRNTNYFRCSNPTNWAPWAKLALGGGRRNNFHEALTRGFLFDAKVCDDYD